jgi:hypothetical protein
MKPDVDIGVPYRNERILSDVFFSAIEKQVSMSDIADMKTDVDAHL